MNQITSATFVRGIVVNDQSLLDSPTPQIAFIGRSNVGKSSLINSLTGKKNLAVTSSSPGRTREVNIYLINNAFYLMDLPGYGYAKASHSVRDQLEQLIAWYFLESGYTQKKVVLIVDALVGPTSADIETLDTLRSAGKDIIVVANKIDKLKQSEYAKQMRIIREKLNHYTIIPFSAKEKKGLEELWSAINND